MENMTYDYKAQRWLDGEPAKLLLKKQLTDELELLKGPTGADYARFIGTDKLKAIANCEESLKKLSI
jgi:hypothetical protein